MAKVFIFDWLQLCLISHNCNTSKTWYFYIISKIHSRLLINHLFKLSYTYKTLSSVTPVKKFPDNLTALIANSGPAAGVNIVVGYKQNWIDIINSALNETWKWNAHTLIWEDLLHHIQTWIRFQSYITPLAAGYSYFAHIQIWIRFQSYIPQNWKLDRQGVPCLS